MITVNTVSYDEDDTYSVLNLAWNNGSRYWVNYVDIVHSEARLVHPKPITALKQVFGRQLKTVNYTHRNWIWTFDVDGLEVIVFGSAEGISIEVHRSTVDDSFDSKFKEFLDFYKERCQMESQPLDTDPQMC